MQLRIATGKPGKGFSKVFADIRNVCGATVPMVEIETEGGLQNLTALAANKADLGFVQVDTFAAMQDSDASIANLQTVMPMNTNLLHVIARSSGYELPPNGMLEKIDEPEVGRGAVLRRIEGLAGGGGRFGPLARPRARPRAGARFAVRRRRDRRRRDWPS